MNEQLDLEIRSASIVGNTLYGTAHVFGKVAKTRHGLETIPFNGMDNALKNSDVRAFHEHDRSKLLGRQSSGTLRLKKTNTGLDFEIDLPDTTYAKDVKEMVARGDLTGMSFGFAPGESKMYKQADGSQVRAQTNIKELLDISLVALPAFEGTSVSLRSQDEQEPLQSQLIKIRHAQHTKER